MENENYSNEIIDDNSQGQPVERGGCLSTFIILMIIGNALSIFLYLGMGEKLTRAAHLPAYTPVIMIVFGMLNVVFAFMIYNWKKMGVYGLTVNSILILIANLMLGMGITSFGGLIGLGILFALINPVWKHFK